ncbi:inositol monophosphatase [Amylibacter marinus]|uniref:Inositol-1-monophosphatase n=1 Tax=Amylibacter marinus TaxID=1475483 RepID=A0ABQ5VRB7_9RHOB|nr:inositol monophosphatase family protein [Amylibacter marinus]GLQ33885.1 inositol monophosphatase [Amylibacter marinus]
MTQWSANINVMLKAIRPAGRAMMRDFNEVDKLQVSKKGPNDFARRADQRTEETLQEILREARPNYGFVGAGGRETKGDDPTRRWIVRSLDGLENFVHGLPHWSVSIALEYKGEIVAAVVLSPVIEELFLAEKGAGTWLNEARVRVSGRTSLEQMVLGTGMPAGTSGNLPMHLKDLARISPSAGGIRGLGAVGLDLAYTAAGRYDGYWNRGLKYWEMAAGLLLVKEAGGLVQSIEADANPMHTGTIIAANSEGHAKFAKLVRDI